MSAINNSTIFESSSFDSSIVYGLLKQVNGWTVVLTCILSVLLYDQMNYISKKGSIAGPKLKVWPIIGPFLESVNPKFEEYKAKWASGPLSCVSVFHKFVVITSTRDLTRRAMSSPAYARPCVVDVAIKILRPHNFVFLDGKAHLDYRKPLNLLFTRQAIAKYMKYQEEMYDFYLDDFVKMCKEEGGARPFMREFREFSCAVALRSFLGTYITEEQVKVISDNYYRVTEALELVNFPWILPYTKAWYGKKIADMTMKIFEEGAQMSKDNMAAGGQVTCVCDDWMKMILDSQAGLDNVDASVKSLLVRDYSNQEISEVFFAFLFAAQDATSSACTWLYQLVADRPDVMKKIREEQLAVRQGDLTRKLDLDLIDKMEYTNMVVKEALRYRPPVTMVPYEVKKPFPISPEYTVPKGAMIVPTLYPALHDPEIYDSPEEFIPDRWTPNSKASLAHKNWLVFGHGPHVCIGRLYIMYHLTAMIGKSALFYDWKHTITPTSEKIRVFATIFPEDNCLLNFTKREDPTLIE